MATDLLIHDVDLALRMHGTNPIELLPDLDGLRLPTVTGAWRDPGGGLCRSTQVWWEEALGLDVEALPQPARKFNMARLGEVLTDPDIDPPIRALFVHNSNPAVIAPDQNRIVAGLERDELFTVVAEQFVTASGSNLSPSTHKTETAP